MTSIMYVSRQCVRLDSSSVLDLRDSVGGLSDGQPDEAGGGQDWLALEEEKHWRREEIVVRTQLTVIICNIVIFSGGESEALSPVFDNW